MAAHPDKVEMQAVEVMKDVPAEGIRDEHSEGLPGELHRSLHSLHGAIVSLRDGRVSDSSQLEEQITAVQALSDRINAILG